MKLKKIAALILAVLQSGSTFISCTETSEHGTEIGSGNAEETMEPERQEAIVRAMSDWFDYLYGNECMYGAAQWTLSYVEEFLNDPTGENLLCAKSSLSTARRYVTQLEKDAATMTAEDYKILMQREYDISFVDEVNTFENVKMTLDGYLSRLEFGLNSYVFLKEDFAYVQQLTDFLQQYCEVFLLNLNIETNYLLVELDDEKNTERFRDMVKEHCPLIDSCRSDFLRDREEIKQITAENLESIQKVISQSAFLEGKLKANQYLWEQIAGDMDKLKEAMLTICDLPEMLPDPGWPKQNVQYYYMYTEEDGSVRAVTVGSTYEELPDTMTMVYPSVSEEKLIAYRNLLTENGYTVSLDEAADGIRLIIVELEGSTLEMLWQEEQLQLWAKNRPVLFAPAWYITAAQ